MAGRTRAMRRPNGRRRRRPASRPRSARVAARPRWSASAPSRRTSKPPSTSIPVTSTTVDGSPINSPPSMARSAAARIASSTSPKPRGRWLAGAVGAGLEDRGHRPGEWALDQPNAEPLRVLAAGERVAALGVGDHQGHRPGQQGARPRRASATPRPETSSRIASGEKYMTAEGLPLVAALDPVDALDRLGVERVAGESVERVGGKTATPPSPMQRSSAARAGRPRRARSRRSRSSRRRRPGRSRPGRRRISTSVNRPRRPAPRPLRLAGADLERDRGRAASPVPQLLEQPLDRLQAGRPADQRLARLVLADLGREPLPFVLADVGQVGERAGRTAPSARSPSDRRPVGRRPPARRARGARRSPARPERVGEVSVATTSALGQLVGDRQRDRAAAGADVEHVAAARARAPARPAARSPAAGSAPAGRRSARSAGTPCGRGCRRPARAATRRRTISRTARAPPAPAGSGSAASAPRSQPVASASSSSASRRGVSHPAAASASTAASSASRRCRRSRRPLRPSPRSAPRAAGASPRTPSAVGELAQLAAEDARRGRCAVSLIRWSVTRPCGKL